MDYVSAWRNHILATYWSGLRRRVLDRNSATKSTIIVDFEIDRRKTLQGEHAS